MHTKERKIINSMSFVEYISNISAKWLANKVPNDKYPNVEDQIQIYEYGWMVIWGAILKISLLVTISSLLGILIPVMILTITFSSFRIIAGGYHFSSYNKCLVFSLVQFISTSLIIKYTLQYWSFGCLWFLFNICVIIGIYNIHYYVPRDTPNKPITEIPEIKRFKKLSYQYLAIWAVIMIMIISMFELKIIVLSSCFGLLLELFSISKFGQLIYSRIDS